MDRLKFLQLNFVKLTGSYADLSEHLRWLCWVGFNESTVRTDIYMGNMVALDMSYSYLEEFDPPMYLPSLKILNLKDSRYLFKIHNFHKIPNLETLILWNCHNLLRVCRTIGNLERLGLLNMAGCKNLFNRVPISTSVVECALELSFPLPRSLQRVFLNDCNLECTDYFPLSFSDQSILQYINLANGHFEILPSYNLLKNLRVLDLRKCSRLKRLICLPSTLAELYIYNCKSIEKITFESGRFTLQEFGYEGCVILSEIEGWVKLLLITKLDESDLGHMIWLKEYQYQEVYLVGDYELTKGRSCHLQMLYEFNIMSTSLLDINHPNLTPEYWSQSTLLSFDVPACPRSSRLKGLTVTFRYTVSGDDWVWFAKIRSTNGVDVMYSPKVFGKPGIGQVGIWLSYWPIGNLLDVGDEVDVSIVVMSGLEVLECGVSLVYTDDDVAPEILKNETGWVESFGRDLSGFQLKRGSYYLCQRDIYKIMEVGRLTPGWLSNLVDDTIDDTEVRGWRMTGRPQQSYQSFIELKTGRYVIRDPGMEGICKNAKISDSPMADKTLGISSSILGESMQSGTESVYGDAEIEVMDISEESEMMEPTSSELSKSTTKELALKTGSLAKVDKLKLKQQKDMELTSSYKNVADLGVASYKSSEISAHPCRRFSLAEIQSATRNFDKALVIGQGRNEKVYKGQISSDGTNHVVAIKRLGSMPEEGKHDIKTEIDMLSKLRHIHLVSLIGFYMDDKEIILVYEYMPRGNLYDHLHKADVPLTWMQRMKIAVGVSRGLEYLHTVGTYGILHRDVKSSNILLDDNWEAMISGYGLSTLMRSFTQKKEVSPYYDASGKGGFGYLDPNYFHDGKLNRKTDVYAFGVLLFELLSGMLAVDVHLEDGEGNLARWGRKCVKEKKFDKMVDSNIKGTVAPKSLRQFAQLADSCLLDVPKNRPTMSEVVASLQEILEQQVKNNDSAKSSSTLGFGSKIKKFFGL